jgi:chorismate mutase
MGHAFEIGKLKKEKSRDVFDGSREDEVFVKLKALPKECIRDDEVKELYEHIITISRKHGKRGLS